MPIYKISDSDFADCCLLMLFMKEQLTFFNMYAQGHLKMSAFVL